MLKKKGVRQHFVLGGDGTQKGSRPSQIYACLDEELAWNCIEESSLYNMVQSVDKERTRRMRRCKRLVWASAFGT